MLPRSFRFGEIMRSFALNTAFILLSIAAVNAQTASPTPPPIDEGEVIKVDSRLVVVPVSVTNAQGDPVQGLAAKDFSIAEEGRRQQVESVGTAAEVPLEIALLVDISASTDAMFKFQQETAAQFLKLVMRPVDRATIYTVGMKATAIQQRETAENAAAKLMSIVPTREQTAFYDSLLIAANDLQKNTPPGRRKVLLIISDGEDTNSEGVLKAIWDAERKIADNVQGEDLRKVRVKARDTAKVKEQIKVLRALQNADTVFYSINPAGSSLQLNQMSMFGQENLQKFADDTGGTAFLPKFLPIDTKDQLANSSNMRKNAATLEHIFKQLTNELRAQYLVQYYSESDFPLNKYVRLTVGLQNGGSDRVRARQGYYVK